MDPTKTAESYQISKNDADSKISANSYPGNVNITSQPLNTIHTKISKLVYDPRSSPSKMNLKSIHTQMNKDCPKLRKKGSLLAMTTFKSKNINLPEFQQQNDSKNKLNSDEFENLSKKNVINQKNLLLTDYNTEKEQVLSSPFETSTFRITNDIINNKTENKLENRETMIDDNQTQICNKTKSESQTLARTKPDLVQKSLEIQILPSKSKSSLNSKTESEKKKSYNSDETKKFMFEQKKKRKNSMNSEKSKNQIDNVRDKTEIKKRLDLLRKNTLKILERNVNLAKKRSSGILQEISPRKTRKIDKTTKAPKSKEIVKLSNPSRILHIEKSLMPNAVSTETKRIGLLRKPHLDDNLNSPISNKENLNLNGLTPKTEIKKMLEKISETARKRNQIENIEQAQDSEHTLLNFLSSEKEKIQECHKLSQHVDKREESEKAQTLNTLKTKHSENEIFDELLSTVPNSTIGRKPAVQDKSIQCDSPLFKYRKPSINSPPKQVPYWLKPSPIQIYPYNFIIAVRKKLEAVTNSKICSNKHITKFESNSPLSHQKMRESVRHRIVDTISDRFENNDERVVKTQEKNTERIYNIESNQYSRNKNSKIVINEIKSMTADLEVKPISDNALTPISNNKVNSKSFTDSNFSSVSIQINPFSATSKSHRKILSSTIVDNKFISDDTTTISSSIFSSPEKKQPKETESNSLVGFGGENQGDISPLSVANISSLKIQSKFLPSKDVNCYTDQPDVATINRSIPGELDYKQLLKDFNDSLSRVVTVNEQLKSSLNETEQIVNVNQNFEQHKNKEQDYTSDFEEESRVSQFKSRSTTSVENLDPSLNITSVVAFDSTISYKNKETPNFNPQQQGNQNVNIMFNSKIESDDEILEIISSDARIAFTSVPKDSLQLSEHISNSEEVLSKTSKSCSVLPSSVSNSIYSAVSGDSSSSQKYSNSNVKSFNNNKIYSNITSSSSISEALVLPYSTEKNDDNDDVSIVHSEKTFLLNNKKEVNNLSTTSKNEHISSISKSTELPPPAYNTITNDNEIRDIDNKLTNTSISNEFIAVFNQSDVELSLYSQSNLSQSETTINYSSIGMYEQLLQNENRKSEQLTTFLKMREKVILSRAKRQVTFLELQKEKLRSHKEGDEKIAFQLSTLKKKQRAVLMRMEKEQEEVKRLMQNQIVKENVKSNRSKTFRQPKLDDNLSEIVIKKSFSTSQNNAQQQSTNTRTCSAIVRGVELKGNNNELEILLKNREKQLEKRREHVQRLIQWNQRLDKEEEEVLQLEKMLYNCNLNEIRNELSADKEKKEKIQRIDNSIKALSNVSDECVKVKGRKLSKLWYDLTGEKNSKLNKNVHYKLSKQDLEIFYEKAKELVIRNNYSDNTESSFNSISNLHPDEEVMESNNSKPDSGNKEKSTDSFEVDKKSFTDKFDNSSSSLLSNNLHSVPITDKETVDSYSIKSTRTKSENLSSKAVSTSSEILNEHISASALINSSSSDKESFENSTEISEIEFNNAEETFLANEASSDSNEISNDSNSENLFRPTVIVSIRNVNDEYHCSTTKIISEEGTTPQISDCIEIISEEISPANEKTISEIATNLEELSLKSSTSIINKIEDSKIQISNPSDTYENNSSLNSSNFIVELPNNSESSETKANNEDINENVKSLNSLQYEKEIFDTDSIVENISLPKFVEEESLEEDSKQFVTDTTSDTNSVEENCSIKNQTDLEKRLIDIDDSLKDLSTSLERALSPEKCSNLSPANILTNRQQLIEIDKSKIKSLKCDLNNGNGAFQTLMPDIISEVDIRRNQTLAENEAKPSEYAIPYIFQREIPNKPPPPYHAPAHGSPMTIIFPSENRIKEITFQRTKELYDDITKNGNVATIDNEAVVPSTNVTMTEKKISCDNITNIYERIVLDICKEYTDEYKNIILESNPDTFKNSLAFFNPPDKLICLQEFIYKNVRKSLGMERQIKLTRNNSVYSVSKCNKRDNVDEILIQELYEEESKWNKFDLEESEVKQAIIENFGANEILVSALFEQL